MKKFKKRNFEPDNYEHLDSIQPEHPKRVKQKRIYEEDPEREANGKISRSYGKKEFRHPKIKGNQWEDWDA